MTWNEVASTQNGLCLNKFYANGSHGNPQIAQAIAKTLSGFLKAHVKALILTITPTQLIEHNEVKLVPT